jgi:spore coat polysaccharide biosynthesis protein SpsF (cytidylyltransferase family)
MARVLIGIQARSGSTRLPRKAFEMISGRTMLDRVIDTCNFAAKKLGSRDGHVVDVVVVTPTNDPIVEDFSNRVQIVEGPEQDVLSRYAIAVEVYKPEVIVRITGDCPLIPGALIHQMTLIAIQHGYDYFSNADERFRTSIDGSDCEVFSRRMLDYAAQHAPTAYDREHVTPFMRQSPPPWAKSGIAIGAFDISDIKLSVDTQEDLERVRQAFSSSFRKIQMATKTYGKGGVHRL